MSALADRFWTPEDILALPDDGARHECIDGVHLVTPTPRMDHQQLPGARRPHAWPEILGASMIWQPMPETAGLTIDLDALFAEVFGDDDAATPSPPASAAPG